MYRRGLQSFAAEEAKNCAVQVLHGGDRLSASELLRSGGTWEEDETEHEGAYTYIYIYIMRHMMYSPASSALTPI